ncbi:thioredoxin family protein [Kribbella sp. CA-293567]|uniref:thioredoxin family protein n=1 Tax=Kribbella sp. CA-293567 TaxID=3002436 RepID=UPI0022DDB622|nr:thioredoxin family protein [Kribbella sp. CA-293567]WBQ03423.1 thioredoxin family protein [Kribbella sp. CA-293567]
MSTIDVTDANVDEVTGRDGIVILDFWAEWCPACKLFAPIYEAASDANPDIVFGKVDVEAATKVADSFGIRALPTLAVFRDQVGVYLQAGALPKPDLEDLLEKIRELDMDQVRSDVAKNRVGHAHHH